MLIDSPAISTALSLTQLEAWISEEEDTQRQILLCRKYFDGEQLVPLTDRLEQFLGSANRDAPNFRFNLLPTITNAMTERLGIKTFDSLDTDFALWVWDVWTACDLETKQHEVYEGALRDGQYYILIGWDSDLDKPEIIPYQRWTDTSFGGDGYGIRLVYPDDDTNQPIEFAVRSWFEIQPKGERRERRTLYYPDKIVKQVRGSKADWQTIETIPWLTQTGEPLGVAVVPFINKGWRSELWDALPLQDLLNKTVIDLASTNDMTAFRIYVALGFIPTIDGKDPESDGSNWFKVEPGRIVGTTKNKSDVDFKAIEPSDTASVMITIKEILQWMAFITDTPASRFSASGQMARSETLKEQDSPLIAKVTNRQTLFGNSWEQVFDYCRLLRQTFSTAPDFDESATVDAKWADAEIRNEVERIEMLVLKREIGIPLPVLWGEAGYTQAQIKEMTLSDEYARLLEALGPAPGSTVVQSEETGLVDDEEDDDVR